jgi:hypothetical protein
MVCEDLRDGIRTNTSAVCPHDGGREGLDLRCTGSGGDRDEEIGFGHDGRGDDQGANVDDVVDYDGTGAGDSGLETGEHT